MLIWWFQAKIMNAKEFREFGYAAIDFIADYMENVHERFLCISSVPLWLIKNKNSFQVSSENNASFVYFRPVLPSVEPGYLHNLLPTEIPERSEQWKDVMTDLNKQIMPGMTHWQSNNFHAYYPSQTSYPSIVGDMIANGLGTVSFSWVSYR